MNKKEIYLVMVDTDGNPVSFNTTTEITGSIGDYAPLICKTLDADGKPIDIVPPPAGPKGVKGDKGDKGDAPLIIDSVSDLPETGTLAFIRTQSLMGNC